MMSTHRGLLLFAHGARDPAWARPFEAVRSRCQGLRPDRPVALAFLEFLPPGLVQAGSTLAEAGCVVVDIVPLFLGAAGHVRRDVPLLIGELATRFPQVRWQLQATVGESDHLVEAMVRVALSLDTDPP